MVKDQIAQKENALEDIQKQAALFHLEYAKIKKADQAQELMCVDLKEKVNRWAKSFEEQKATAAQTKRAIIERLIEKRDMQQEFYFKQALQQTVLPLVVNEAHKELVDFFSSPERQKEYIERIVHQLKRLKHE